MLLEKSIATGNRRRRKSPSKLRRDRARRAKWLLQLRENRRAQEILPETSSPVVSAEQLEQGPKELSNDIEEYADERPNSDLCLDSTDFAAPQCHSESSVTNCDCEDSFLDSDEESVDPVEPPFKEVPELCVACGKMEGKFYFCSKCKAVKYCGATCQKDNWKQHKFACATLKDLFGK